MACILFLLLVLLPLSSGAQEDSLRHYNAETADSIYFLPTTLTFPAYYGVNTLLLHPGLNAEVGMGVRIGFGRNNPWKGASFFSTLTALYAVPLSKDGRWTAAFGGYYDNYRLWNSRVNQFGVMGVVGCQLNERLNLSAFLMHDFGLGNDMFYSPSRSRRGMWHMTPGCVGLTCGAPVTTVGANLGIKLSEKAAVSIGVSVSRQQDPIRYEPHPNGNYFPAPVNREPDRGGTRVDGKL